MPQMKRICLQCGRSGFSLWVGKIPWRRKWQPTSVFLPGEFLGQIWYMGLQRVRNDWETNTFTFHIYVCVHVNIYVSSVQFSRSVVSDPLRPHESQNTRPPCPSPSPGVHSDSRPQSPWCHPAISSSVVPFSSCPQSLPASESFPMSQLFAWGGPSTGVSALA